MRNLQSPDARQRIEGLRTDAFDMTIAKITAGSERAEIRFGSTEREEFRVVSPKGAPPPPPPFDNKRRKGSRGRGNLQMHDDVVRKVRISKEIVVDFFDLISSQNSIERESTNRKKSAR